MDEYRITHESREYCLELADGTRWGLSADNAAVDWLQMFASILSLPPLAGDQSVTMNLHFSNDQASEGLEDKDAVTWEQYGVSYSMSSEDGQVAARLESDLEGKERLYSMWSAVQPIYRFTTLQGGAPLHAALLVRYGCGILVAAPGGTGKTTTFHRLPDDWAKITDDEILAVKVGDGYRLHPFPTWSRFLLNPGDHRWETPHHFPLSAFFFLKQADDVRLEKLGQAEAAVMIHQSMRQILRRSWNLAGPERERELKLLAFQTSSDMAKKIPCWFLNLPIEGDFSEEIDRVLRDEGLFNE